MSAKFWQDLRQQAEVIKSHEHRLARLIDEAILNKESLEQILTYRLAESLGEKYVSAQDLEKIFLELFDHF